MPFPIRSLSCARIASAPILVKKDWRESCFGVEHATRYNHYSVRPQGKSENYQWLQCQLFQCSTTPNLAKGTGHIPPYTEYRRTLILGWLAS